MNYGRAPFYGIGAAVALVAVFFLLGGSDGPFAFLGRAVLWAAGIAVALVLVIVAAVIYSALHSSERKSRVVGNTTGERQANKAELKPEEKELLTAANRELSALRVLVRRVKNKSVRELSVQTCDSISRVLSTLREKPETLPQARQFLHYYLPTLGKIMQRYAQMEQSGLVDDGMTQNTLSSLKNIQTATKKQHSNLFAADALDLAVEMEVMTTLLRRDGLLDEQDFLCSDEPEADSAVEAAHLTL